MREGCFFRVRDPVQTFVHGARRGAGRSVLLDAGVHPAARHDARTVRLVGVRPAPVRAGAPLGEVLLREHVAALFRPELPALPGVAGDGALPDGVHGDLGAGDALERAEGEALGRRRGARPAGRRGADTSTRGTAPRAPRARTERTRLQRVLRKAALEVGSSRTGLLADCSAGRDGRTGLPERADWDTRRADRRAAPAPGPRGSRCGRARRTPARASPPGRPARAVRRACPRRRSGPWS